MDVSVGPLSNSFETAMMHVDTMTLTAYEYPRAPSAFEPQGPPNTQTAPPAPTQADSSFSSSLDPNTSVIESLIRGMSEKFLAQLQESSFTAKSQFSKLSQRIQKLEQPSQPQPYSPSTVAAPWCPPTSSFACDTPPGSYDHIDLSKDVPLWFYGDSRMDSDDDDEPDWPVSYLQDLFFHRHSFLTSHTLTDSQRNYILTLPSLFATYCNHFHFSPDHHLTDYDTLSFWNFIDEYKKIESEGRDPLLVKNDAMNGGPSGSPDQPECPVPHPLSSAPVAPLGSIHLFPSRAPSQPPITTINDPTPLRAPVSDHARGRARPSVAQEVADPPVAPIVPPPNAPWNVMGRGNKPRSFAAVAAP